MRRGRHVIPIVGVWQDEDGDVHVASTHDRGEARAAAERGRVRDHVAIEEWPDCSGAPERWWMVSRTSPGGDVLYLPVPEGTRRAIRVSTWRG